jgi:hypothetical protein
MLDGRIVLAKNDEEIRRLIAEGASSATIAGLYNISRSSVDRYRARHRIPLSKRCARTLKNKLPFGDDQQVERRKWAQAEEAFRRAIGTLAFGDTATTDGAVRLYPKRDWSEGKCSSSCDYER